MMKNCLFNAWSLGFRFSEKKMILPEAFTSEKVDDYFLVKSQTYEFLIKHLPEKHEIYKHEI